MSIELFLLQHQKLESSFQDFQIFYTNPSKLHNHTLDNLFLYFSLEDHMKKGRVHFYYSSVFINDRRRFKWFCNGTELIDSIFDISLFTTEERNKMSFYSDTELLSDLLVKTKFKESVYNLDNIFNPQFYYKKYEGKSTSYIKKKIYSRIEYPFRFLQRVNLDIRDITELMLPKIYDLHKEWCEFKLNDPKTFKMMFSSNRYYRCLQQSFTSQYLCTSNWYRKAFFLEDRLIAIRHCLIQGDTSYDIGFFSRFWDIPSNIVNYINTWCMRDLQNLGVKYHNCGNELDKNLKKFKEHFPTEERFGFKYNFKK